MDDTPAIRSELRFAKYHGTGNDFVMLEDPEGELQITPALVARLCDRRFGVGADGLIRVASGEVAVREGVPDSEGTDFFMDYYNADGAAAEMCGNGVRCLGKLVYERGLTVERELVLATRAGPKRLWLDVRDGIVEAVTVDMGPPGFERERIPMTGPPQSTFLTEDIESDARAYKASAVSMGNPHLVLFVDEDPDELDVASIGPVLETHDAFPNRTNVEFVAPAEGGIKVRVWERGVGETMACGTGACASLVAAHLAGFVPRRADVRFPGGTLDVDWRDEGVFLTGPAVRVYEGTLDLDALLARSDR
jgi:diaminopimelate epimerase